MSILDMDTAIVTQGYDREKLKVGKYLVRLKDSRAVVGGYNGNRYQLTFEVVKGRFAAPGTVKSDIIMIRPLTGSQKEDEKIKKDQGKIKKTISAFLNVKPEAITNARNAKITREQVVRSTQTGVEVLSESFQAEQGEAYGKLAVCLVKPYTRKTGEHKGKQSCFYEYAPFDGNMDAFEEYDPSTYAYEDEDAPEADTDDGLADVAAAAKAAEVDEPPPPPEEDEPLTKAAKDGWKVNPKSPAGTKWFFRGKEQLKEAALIQKYS